MDASGSSHGGGTAAAAAQVLYCPELLEMILLTLPMRDILFSQRVCSTFKAAISSSVALQRRLFFIPTSKPLTFNNSSESQLTIFTTNDPSKLMITCAPISAEDCCFAPSGHMFSVNPLLSSLWPVPPPPSPESTSSRCYNPHWNRLHIASRMPLIRPVVRLQSLRLSIPTKGTPHITSTTSSSDKPKTAAAAAVAINHPHASWRNMYLTQPPVCNPIAMARYSSPCGTVDCEDGVTLACVKKWEDEFGGNGPTALGNGDCHLTHLTLLFGEVRGEEGLDG